MVYNMKTKQNALDLLHEWVKNESLKKHCLGVALCMEAYARKKELEKEAVDKYWICGLLHDFDWERYPKIELHPDKGCEYLKENGYDEDIVLAILGHNARTGVKRESDMSKVLFAVDELSGLVIALAKIRPGNFEGMSVKSVKKAVKKKDFAKAVNRDDINLGISELGVEKEEHIQLVISALSEGRKELGF
jgi:predicted hydrolase (HD superfamily)